MARIHAEIAAEGGWFFQVWQPDEVLDPETGKSMPIQDAPDSLLMTNPETWVLHPGDDWHGFSDLEDGYCMLDPIKVSVVTPGMSREGRLLERGIPASIVTAYLTPMASCRRRPLTSPSSSSSPSASRRASGAPS
jgi:arginine/lysine/ornithine decarboxylase